MVGGFHSGTSLAISSAMPIEICMGRAAALLVHPAAAWIRLSARGRVMLLGAYATASYFVVLSALLAL